MAMLLSSFKRLAAAGLTVGLMGLGTAVPAQADSFSFKFSFGNKSGYSERYSPRPQYRQRCVTNPSIVRALYDKGYRDVRYVNERYHGKPKFQAVRGGWHYSMLVDRCTGHLSSLRQLRPVNYHPRRDHWSSRPSHGGKSHVFYWRR